MKVTFKGKPVELEGIQPNFGERAPFFLLPNLSDELISLDSLLNKPLIISVVPNIDTRICAIQTKRFNQDAANLDSINFVTISNNSKEELANWCAAEGVNMTMLRDSDLEFGKNYGLFVPEIGHLARAIFVLNQNGDIVYEEIVSEVANEPNYEKALLAAETIK